MTKPNKETVVQGVPIEQGDVLAGTKASLITVLATHGITHVTVFFDGCSDSGQINEIQAFSGNEQVDLPDATIQPSVTSPDTSRDLANPVSLYEGIENYAYNLLDQDEPGWEINDGSFGNLTLHVDSGRTELVFNQRFQSFEHRSRTL